MNDQRDLTVILRSHVPLVIVDTEQSPVGRDGRKNFKLASVG